MEERLIEDPTLRDRGQVFADRFDAGRRLASFLEELRGASALVLAVPSGGVPVALELRRALDLPVELAPVRKVQLPWSTEAGCGAVNLDGDVVLNEEMLGALRLSGPALESQIEKARESVLERNRLFRRDRPFPDFAGRRVVLVDDGLASGSTLRAAVPMARRRDAEELWVAVPTGSRETAEALAREVDRLICLNVRGFYPFAVADAYRHWHDLIEDEVLALLRDLDIG